MSEAPHRLILASAGTGKTFQLSGHFLRLLAGGRQPERILATTFTRKAAGEILDRVLTRLLRAVRDEGERQAIGAPGLDAEACVDLLADATRRLHRFRVRTLDAFFVQVAQLFALDLDLPPAWNIVDDVDDRRLRSRALARALADAPATERLELLRGIQRSGASRAVSSAALAVVGNGRSAFLDSAPEAWERVLPEAGRLDDARLEEAIAALREVEVPKARRGPDGRFTKACTKIANAAASGDWATAMDGGLVTACYRPAGKYYGVDVGIELADAVRRVVDHAIHQAAAAIDRQDRSARSFLERFERAYRDCKREQGAYRFEDLPLLLAPADGDATLDERLADLWFRLDGRIDDVLLDEFQDTSPVQWRALAPLAEEILTDPERTFFCVGDVKQSIYGWRGAEPRMLASLADRYPQLHTDLLTRSWRSSAVVLDVVDRVFDGLESSPSFAEAERPSWSSAAREFAAGYSPHQTARGDQPGEVVVFEAEDLGDVGRSLVGAAALRVKEIVERAPHATVGVLVRKRKRIPALLHALREAGVRASGEGGNPLTDSEAVQVVLSALHLADHPDDTVAAFHVGSSPLGGMLNLAADADTDRRREVSSRLRSRLVHEGYGAVVTAFADRVRLDPAWAEWDQRRMRQLIDLAIAHDQRASLRPSEFAEAVRETRVEDPDGAQVRVMTIHSSKGLEFDAVVLAELDACIVDASQRSLVTQRTDPYGPLTRVSLGFPRDLAAHVPELGELDHACETREIVDALCLLYVAMTRAARRLELIVPAADATKSRTYAAVVREQLCGDARGPGRIYRHPNGSDDWACDLDEPRAAGEPDREPTSWTLRAGGRQRSLPARAPSREEHRETSVEALLAPPRRVAVRTGTLVHRLFEEVEWLDGFDQADDDLAALLEPLEADPSRRREAVAAFRTACRKKEIAALLSCPELDADSEVEVLRERPFSAVVPDDQGAEELWTGAIDRLVVRRTAGTVVAAEVVDFKTDAVPSDALTAKVDAYRPQLEAYRLVAAAITGLKRRHVRACIAFVTPGIVVSV